jgi:hypothetical protein
MNIIRRMFAGGSLIVAVFFLSGHLHAQQQSLVRSPGENASLEVGHVDYSKSLESLLNAAHELRKSIQELAQQEVGPQSSAAIEASHEALLQTQRAMLRLPPDWRIDDVEVREAKEWPKVMARLDAATRSLENSLKTLSKRPDLDGWAEAMASVRRAISETEQAMLALPEADTKNYRLASAHPTRRLLPLPPAQVTPGAAAWISHPQRF